MFTTWAHHGSDTDGDVTHGPRHRGEVGSGNQSHDWSLVRPKVLSEDISPALGSEVNVVGRRSVVTTGRAGRVRAAVDVLGHGEWQRSTWGRG